MDAPGDDASGERTRLACWFRRPRRNPPYAPQLQSTNKEDKPRPADIEKSPHWRERPCQHARARVLPRLHEMTNEQKSAVARLIALVAFIIALFLAMRFLPVQPWLRDFNDWIGQMGAAGIFIFIIVYAAATVLLAPGAILTIGAGFTFGLWKAFLAVSAGATLGAALAFLVARFLARDKVEAIGERLQSEVDRFRMEVRIGQYVQAGMSFGIAEYQVEGDGLPGQLTGHQVGGPP